MTDAADLPLHPKVRVVFREGVIYVLEKPAGLLTHPNRGEPAEASILQAPYNEKREAFECPGGSLFLVHRLDRETSGILLCTEDETAAEKLKTAFAERSVEKNYLSVVLGLFHHASGTWENHLEKNRGRPTPVRKGTPEHPLSVTDFKLIEAFPKARASLLQLSPRTGRTHQLRVQAKLNGHPIIGDRQYGDFTSNRDLSHRAGLKRLFLHATHLTFSHPMTGRRIDVDSPLPSELHDCLERVRTLESPVLRHRSR